MEDKFYLLFQCYISGQMNERQWQEHLKDPGLKEWYTKYKEDKKEILEEKFRSLQSG
jgi:hypothetical protein